MYNSPREFLGLDRVLIAGSQQNLLAVIAVLVPEPRRLLGQCVEGNFDLDASRCAEDVDALKKRRLCGACKRGGPVSEIQNGGDKLVCLKARIVLHDSHHALRLGIKNEPRQRNAVATDVHQSPATRLGLVADVPAVSVEIREHGMDGSEFADAALVDDLAGTSPLRMHAIHESLHDF